MNFQFIREPKSLEIGFVPQYGGFFHDLSVYDNLKAISEITEKIIVLELKK